MTAKSPVYVTDWALHNLAADLAAATVGGERHDPNPQGLVVEVATARPVPPNPQPPESAGPVSSIAAAVLRDAAEQLDHAGQRAAALFVSRLANKHEANALT